MDLKRRETNRYLEPSGEPKEPKGREAIVQKPNELMVSEIPCGESVKSAPVDCRWVHTVGGRQWANSELREKACLWNSTHKLSSSPAVMGASCGGACPLLELWAMKQEPVLHTGSKFKSSRQHMQITEQTVGKHSARGGLTAQLGSSEMSGRH